MIFGTAIDFNKKRIVVTGMTGAFGKTVAGALERKGATIVPWNARSIEAPDWTGIDILILAHGARGAGAWMANFHSFKRLADDFICAGKGRLVPPEIWAVGSESELWEKGEYGDSKRALADYAVANWRGSPDVTYRHIVPAAYRSRMGWFPLSPKIVVWVALFLIARGFNYVPVTWTTIAYWNWFAYRARGERRMKPGLFPE